MVDHIQTSGERGALELVALAGTSTPAICLAVVGINLLGDGLADALNPRLARRVAAGVEQAWGTAETS